MAMITAKVACSVRRSFRVEQVCGMFDLLVKDQVCENFSVEVPGLEEDWKLGAIVGPSGSGKSTIAKHAFGKFFYQPGQWSEDQAVIDGFGDASAKKIVQTLTAVGFSSPPSWIKPYRVLSTGEKFRCDLARALLHHLENVVFDEFTSVVDRTVAHTAAAAVSKSIRTGRIDKRLVVVTCHYDVLDWLQPDWVVDMATGRLARGALRRPDISLEIIRCRPSAWDLFAKHHYLSGSLAPMSTCYMALWDGNPVAFCAVMALFGYPGRRRIHRVVTLPDYQGIGIGVRFLEHVCQLEREKGHRVNITTSHPAIIGYSKNSPLWRVVRVSKIGNIGKQVSKNNVFKSSAGRSVVSFEYLGGEKKLVPAGEALSPSALPQLHL